MRQDGRGVAVVAQVVFGQCRDWRAAFCTVLSNKGFESRLRIKTANHHAKAFPDYAARSPRLERIDTWSEGCTAARSCWIDAGEG
jgi:hypothetical protein